VLQKLSINKDKGRWDGEDTVKPKGTANDGLRVANSKYQMANGFGYPPEVGR